jgi:lipase
VKVVDQGAGPPVVFLHSGVGSTGEWRDVFSAWPTGYRLIAVDAFRGGSGPGDSGCRTLDDFADQVHAVVVMASVAVLEPEAYSLLTAVDGPAFTALRNLRDRWHGHVQAGDGDSYAAFEEFIDFRPSPQPRWRRWLCRCTSSKGGNLGR